MKYCPDNIDKKNSNLVQSFSAQKRRTSAAGWATTSVQLMNCCTCYTILVLSLWHVSRGYSYGDHTIRLGGYSYGRIVSPFKCTYLVIDIINVIFIVWNGFKSIPSFFFQFNKSDCRQTLRVSQLKALELSLLLIALNGIGRDASGVGTRRNSGHFHSDLINSGQIALFPYYFR